MMSTTASPFIELTPKQHRVHGYYYPAQGHAKAQIIVAPAMGVPQTYYRSFAQWLNSHGYGVYTFDYFGMAESAPADLRSISPNILDWATEDGDSIIRRVRREHPESELIWLAHSVGGQLFAALTERHHIRKMITIATGSGYWLENAKPLKRKAWLLWFLIVPISLRLYGYFPGNKLGMVADMPASIMRQWRRWCLHREYLVGIEGDGLRAQFSDVTIPITSISMSDDELLSEANTRSLHEFYQQAPVRYIRLQPNDLGIKRIGHLGFFRSEFEPSLWQTYVLPELTETSPDTLP